MAAQEEVGFDTTLEADFIRAVNWASWLAERITASKGFHAGRPSLATDMLAAALVHSEVSELVEYLRHGNPPDTGVPAYLGAEIEAADIVIRLLSWCGRRKWRLGEAIMAKMRYNQTRPFMHGGKAC